MKVHVRWSRPIHYALLIAAQLPVWLNLTRAGHWDWWITFHPNADVLRRIVLAYGQFPWWNPWVRGGVPFFADPQVAVVSPESLLVLAFGAVVGLKLGLLLYTLIGYEGTRALLRHLLPDDRDRATWFAVLPALLPALSGHLASGAFSYVSFGLFPWVVLFSLTWRRSRWRALGLGVTAGLMLLTNVHYIAMMALTIAAVIVLVTFVRGIREDRTWAHLALAGMAVAAVALTRVVYTVDYVLGFPQQEGGTYPIAVPLTLGLQALFAPLRGVTYTADAPVCRECLVWGEVGCYVGVPALVAALVGLRQPGRWRVRWWHVIVPVLLILAWNNRDPWWPSTWLWHVQPWRSLMIVTRWSIFATYFLLVATVAGAAALLRSRRRWVRLAGWGLGVLIVLDLGAHVGLLWREVAWRDPPPWSAADDPPAAVHVAENEFWPAFRRNEDALGVELSLLRYENRTARRARGDPGYAGEFVGRRPVTVERWSPNAIRLTTGPGDVVTANINPGSYWLVQGARTHAAHRPVEPVWPFQVRADGEGGVDLRVRPPYLGILLALQGLFAAATVVVLAILGRRPGRGSDACSAE